MNYEDTLKVGAKVYNVGFIELGGKYYELNNDGTVDFSAGDNELQGGYDEDGNPIEATDVIYLDFGKCIILPNTSARTVTLVDGSTYVYSYEVYSPLNAKKYKMLPKEGDKVWITKKDETIDKVVEVKGFVTYKKRYLKIWL